MGTIQRNAIYCPSSHPGKKILLLVGYTELNIHCKEHKWLRIQLLKNGRPINFQGVTAKISEFDDETFFDLQSVPGVAIGEFKNKRKNKCLTS